MSRTAVIRAMHVSLRIGEVMLQSSVAVAEVQRAMTRMNDALGLDDCEVSVTLDTIMVCAWVDGEPTTLVRVVEMGDPQLDRLLAVDGLSRRIAAREIGADAALDELDRIVARPHRYPPAVVFAALAASTCAWIVFAGGWWPGIVTGLGVTVALATFTQWWGQVRLSGFFGAATAAAVVVAVTHGFSWLGLPVNTPVAIAGALYPLLPGGALVAAVTDGLLGAPISSTAKVLEVIRQATALALGALGALAVVVALELDGELVAATTPESVRLMAAGVAIAALAVARGVPLPLAGVAAGLAMAAALVPSATPARTWSRALAVFAAAVVIGVGGRALARLRRINATVLTTNAVYVLVPGTTIYAAMVAFARDDPAAGGELVVAAVRTAVAIAAGVALGVVVAGIPVRRRRSPSGADRQLAGYPNVP